MIVPMKKATILFRTGDAEATVTCLRKLGLLHVEHQNPPEGRDISELQEKVDLINSSFDVLNRATASKKNIQPQNNITGDWTAVADHIIELGHQLEQREASSSGLSTAAIRGQRPCRSERRPHTRFRIQTSSSCSVQHRPN